jgi:hypothetical protein
MTESIPQCCCQRRDCLAFLTHRQHIDELEQKNALAGQLGQVCLNPIFSFAPNSVHSCPQAGHVVDFRLAGSLVAP